MRISSATAAILLSLLGAFGGCAGGRLAAPAMPDEWPMFRGGPERLGGDGRSDLPTGPPSVAWVFTDGKPNLPVTFWSSPLVHDKKLYVGGGVLSVFGTRGTIYCLDPYAIDPATKKPRVIWKHKTGMLVFSSPSLADGLVLCGEGTHTDTGAQLYALKAGSDKPEGESSWEFKVPGTVEASPCVSGGRVYFGTGDDFHCLDLKTGEERWKVTIVDVLSSPVPTSRDGLVFVGSGRSEMARPENRKLEGQQLLALNAATGEVRWRQPLRFPCNSPITYAEGGRIVAGMGKGTFIVTGGRSAGEVICHDAKTGRQLWSSPLKDNVLAAIPVQHGRVHVACRDGTYYLLDLADGRVLWEYKCDAALLASPVVSGSRVLLISCKGVAHCLDFRNKALLWTLDLPQAAGLKKTTEAFSSPVLADGRIYVGLGSLGLVCLEKTDHLPLTSNGARLNDPGLLLVTGRWLVVSGYW
jgi:outer membrane protein assembly factor BamB